jgi:hypothetical protein
MATSPYTPEKQIEEIMNDAQTLLNFCGTTFAKPTHAWYACLVCAAILTAELDVPLDMFFEGFEQAYKDALKVKKESPSYDH